MKIIRKLTSTVNYLRDMISFMSLPESQRKAIIRQHTVAKRAKERTSNRIALQPATWQDSLNDLQAVMA